MAKPRIVLTQSWSREAPLETTNESYPSNSWGQVPLNLMLTSVALLLTVASSTPPAGAWSVNANNTLVWGGKAYMPIGARVDGTPEAIKKAQAAGIQDLIVELPANGAGWDEALAALNEGATRWFLAVASAAPAALGTVVEPQGFRMNIQGKLDVDATFQAAEQTLAIVVDKRSFAVRTYQSFQTPNGRLKASFDSQVQTPHVLLFYPVTRDLRTPDFWEGFDGHRDTLLQTLKSKNLDDNFRGIIDPMGSVARFPSPDIMFVPRSPIFAVEMESYLREKYGAVATCLRAWSIGAHDITGWDQLARLVPLWSDVKGIESVWDPVKDKVYPSDRETATVWTDIRTVIRSTAIRRYARLIQSIQEITDVPVIQTWGGWSGPYDGAQTGVAGVGCAFQASSISDVIESASRPASTVLQNDRSKVFMVTGLGIAPGSQLDIDTAIQELKGMGARGWFFRTTDPQQLSRIGSLAGRYRLDSADADWKPRALYYPEGARDAATMPVKLFGGTWMLPSPAAGNRLELGSNLRGYYYSGLPRPYTVIWARRDPVETRLFLADPKSVKVESLDGSEVRIRVRKDSIELEITDVPLIFSGIEDVPIPEASYEEMVLTMTALFGNFGLLVDPGGDQEFLFAQNTTAFKRNPIGGYTALMRQFTSLAPRAAPYLWIEAERSPETNFGEPRYVPGASAGDALVLESKLSDSKGYYARYPLRPRTKGAHEFWLAADIPASLRSEVTLVVDGKVLSITEGPKSFYGLDLAWYKLGTAELKPESEVRLQVSPRVSSPIKVDVLVASPGPFVPNGSSLPLDFLRPGG